MRISDWSSDVCSSDLAQHPGRAPAGAHLRHHVEHPVDDRVAGVQHLELRLVLAAAALRGDVDMHLVAGHHLDVEDRRRVVLRIDAAERRIRSEAHTYELQSLMRNPYAVS